MSEQQNLNKANMLDISPPPSIVSHRCGSFACLCYFKVLFCFQYVVSFCCCCLVISTMFCYFVYVWFKSNIFAMVLLVFCMQMMQKQYIYIYIYTYIYIYVQYLFCILHVYDLEVTYLQCFVLYFVCVIMFQLTSNYRMASRAPGWTHMKFDHVSVKNQLKNSLKSSRLDPYEIDNLSSQNQI